MLRKLLEFMKQAGYIAKNNQKDIIFADQHKLKDENIYSIVTKTDIQISELFNNFIKNNFSELNYIIIDEETLDSLGVSPLDKLRNTEYTFIIDPIDGTQTYSLKMPEYGISVGVLKYGKPYIGLVYAPAIDEIVYFDGENSFWLQDAFMENQKSIILSKKESLPQALVFDNSWVCKINNNVDFSKDTVISLYSAVLHMLYIVTGRAKAYYFGVYVWDMAGAWPILRNLGFEFINYNDQEILEEISDKDFNNKMKIKNAHIICKPEYFMHFKNITDLR